MFVLRDSSIRQKLVLLIVVTSILVLAVAFLAETTYNTVRYLWSTANDLQVRAAIAGQNCQAALTFADPEACAEILAAFRSDPHIIGSAVFRPDGTEFAHYARSDRHQSGLTLNTGSLGPRFEWDQLVLGRTIELNGEPIGTVFILSDYGEVYSEVWWDLSAAGVVVLLCLAFSWFLASKFQRLISTPILSLAETVRVIEERHDYSIRAEPRARDEVGMLVKAFNNMLARVQEREEELRRELALRRQTEAELERARDTLEVRVEERTRELSASNRSLEAEIRERQRVEAQRERLMDDLKRANRDLEDFAFVVSHDLRAPLRGITSVVGWMSESYSQVLDPQGREYLGLLSNRARRLHDFIEGILLYSRAGRQQLKPEWFSSEELVVEVLDDVAPPAAISVRTSGSLPQVCSDRLLLRQVFQNLIGNAVKHLGKPAGEIMVSCVEQARTWEFCVSDNGVGIEARHFERIFKMFQSLKPRDEVESTGIGLALVKRIVERQGGAIRVESTVGQGSAFFFTIPRRDP